MALKLSQDSYPENELQIMKKCNNQCVVKLLDSFSIEIPYMGELYAIVMDFYEVNKAFILNRDFFHSRRTIQLDSSGHK